MAKIILDAGDHYIAASNATIYGNSGSEIVTVEDGVVVTTDPNVDFVSFSHLSSDFTYKATSTGIQVIYNGSVMANVTAGQNLVFTNGTAAVASSFDPDVGVVFTLGGVTVSTTANLITPSFSTTPPTTNTSNISATLSQAQAKSQTNANIDTAALLTITNPIVQSLNASMQNTDWKWHKTDITYSYNISIPSDYPANNVTTTGFVPVSSSVQAVTDAYMQAADELLALNISKVADNGDIRFNTIEVGGNENGYAYYPSSYHEYGGDIFLSNTMGANTDVNSDIRQGKYGSMTINHELGHALGLKHPFEDGVTLPAAQDHRVHSIMSYTDFKEFFPVFTSSKTANGNQVEVSYETVFPDSFMVYDIAALQALYGADTTTNTGNNIYYFDPEGTVRAAVYEEGAFYYNLPLYHSIWDAGGIDTLNLASTSHSNTIRLTSGSYSDLDYRSVATQIADQQAKYQTELNTNHFDNWVADVYNQEANNIYTGENALGIAYGTVLENAVGGSAADTFYDNSVNNILTGNAGDDVFYLGAGGFDSVIGGDGEDKLVLSVNKANTQIEKQATGETLVVADGFAVSLAGVEAIQFNDQLYMVG